MYIKEELNNLLKEVSKINLFNREFILRVDVNEDPNKKGIKVQFVPVNFDGIDTQTQNNMAIELATKLNKGLSHLGLTVERDRQLKDKSIIGFFIYLEYVNKIIVQALQQETK